MCYKNSKTKKANGWKFARLKKVIEILRETGFSQILNAQKKEKHLCLNFDMCPSWGADIDKNLTWKMHFGIIENKISKNIQISYKIS